MSLTYTSSFKLGLPPNLKQPNLPNELQYMNTARLQWIPMKFKLTEILCQFLRLTVQQLLVGLNRPLLIPNFDCFSPFFFDYFLAILYDIVKFSSNDHQHKNKFQYCTI